MCTLLVRMSLMSKYRLKKCPFCGGTAFIKEEQGHCFTVNCANDSGEICSVLPKTWTYDTKEEAVEAWNKRYPNKEKLNIPEANIENTDLNEILITSGYISGWNDCREYVYKQVN